MAEDDGAAVVLKKKAASEEALESEQQASFEKHTMETRMIQTSSRKNVRLDAQIVELKDKIEGMQKKANSNHRKEMEEIDRTSQQECLREQVDEVLRLKAIISDLTMQLSCVATDSKYLHVIANLQAQIAELTKEKEDHSTELGRSQLRVVEMEGRICKLDLEICNERDNYARAESEIRRQRELYETECCTSKMLKIQVTEQSEAQQNKVEVYTKEAIMKEDSWKKKMQLSIHAEIDKLKAELTWSSIHYAKMEKSYEVKINNLLLELDVAKKSSYGIVFFHDAVAKWEQSQKSREDIEDIIEKMQKERSQSYEECSILEKTKHKYVNEMEQKHKEECERYKRDLKMSRERCQDFEAREKQAREEAHTKIREELAILTKKMDKMVEEKATWTGEKTKLIADKSDLDRNISELTIQLSDLRIEHEMNFTELRDEHRRMLNDAAKEAESSRNELQLELTSAVKTQCDLQSEKETYILVSKRQSSNDVSLQTTVDLLKKNTDVLKLQLAAVGGCEKAAASAKVALGDYKELMGYFQQHEQSVTISSTAETGFMDVVGKTYREFDYMTPTRKLEETGEKKDEIEETGEKKRKKTS